MTATATGPASCVRGDRANGMTDVRAVSAKARNSAGDWVVDLTLTPADRPRLADLTSTLATAASPSPAASPAKPPMPWPSAWETTDESDDLVAGAWVVPHADQHANGPEQ
ncbi:hypothetical protein [Streptomyces sp. NPDC088350]|uniref:hypothetical protein n=1 Tax=Streptomyces sp. NPDC088350 TaxID=3365854 RepID=UPI00380C2387